MIMFDFNFLLTDSYSLEEVPLGQYPEQRLDLEGIVDVRVQVGPLMRVSG